MIFVQYQWFVIVGAFLSFFMSWGIGANDVANSFATAIGAKTLTLFQACCIAACLEFLGAMTLGGEVSKTIASSIAKTKEFSGAPEIYAYGMLASLLSASLWVTFASYKGYAVSTTHSIIGSVIGFTIVWKGADGVIWYQATQEFPYVKGIIPIIVSWFTSPIMSSLISAVLFLANRQLVLRRNNSKMLAYYALPPLVFVTIFINLFFILYKGAKAELAWEASKSAWVSAIVAGWTSFLSGLLGIPFIKWYIKKKRQNKIVTTETIQSIQSIETIQLASNSENKNLQTIIDMNNQNQDIVIGNIVEYVNENKTHTHGILSIFTSGIGEQHKELEKNAEIFDEDTENIYKYLQVFSSCCVAFAHGANDVANAIGPYAAIWYIYENSSISPEVNTPRWMLALGGIGIVVGLWTYGYNVIKSLGGQLCYLSPSRGYCAELATALTVSFASVYGIPISTTHCIVGAEIGIGIVEGFHGVNWKLFAKTFTAWIFTLIVSGLLCAIVFSQGVYSPSIQMDNDIKIYEDNIIAIVMNKNKSLLNDTEFANNILSVSYIHPGSLLFYVNNTCLDSGQQRYLQNI